jgi:hypothetical protein
VDTERADISADIGDGVDAERQEASVGIKRELGDSGVVAPLIVGEKTLAAGGDPVDGTAELACRNHQRRIFRIDRRLQAEAAADIVGEHAD